MGISFHFSSLYPAPDIELYVCYPIWISYLNFRAVLVLPKMAGSAQTHKSMSFIRIVWSTLYVYLWLEVEASMEMTFGLWWGSYSWNNWKICPQFPWAIMFFSLYFTFWWYLCSYDASCSKIVTEPTNTLLHPSNYNCGYRGSEQ